MEATTIKIENPLLKELNSIRPRDLSFSAFVRLLLEQDIQRQKMIQAADKYSAFLEANPEEKDWLQGWEGSDLAASPKKAPKGKRAKK